MHNCNILKIYQMFIRRAIAASSRAHDLCTMGDYKSLVLFFDKDGRNRDIGASFGLQRG
jgi:hypothetical protein